VKDPKFKYLAKLDCLSLDGQFHCHVAGLSFNRTVSQFKKNSHTTFALATHDVQGKGNLEIQMQRDDPGKKGYDPAKKKNMNKCYEIFRKWRQCQPDQEFVF
jgi:hypothetical protein